MQNQVHGRMGDKELINDSLASQKYITSSYNTYANECVNSSLRNDMMSILNDEHAIQADIFNELQSHGWYQVQNAEPQKIMQAKSKFSSQ